MTINFSIINNSLPIDNLTAYTHRVNNIPLLGEQEEHDLAIRYTQHDDLEAAKKLVMSHLRFVIKIARKYSGYGLSHADLIQEGNVGLMKAVKRFDPTVGVRLVSFAVHWIKAEIHEFILRNWRIVKIATTKAQRKLFFNLRSLKKQIAWLKQQEVTDIANELKVKEKTVLEMESRLHGQDESFDAHACDEAEEQAFAPAQYLADHAANPELLLTNSDTAADNKSRLMDAFDQLDERSKEIIQRRWLDEEKATLQELANEYQVSAERIRQLEKQAMQKIKQQLEAA
ncbi:MAG: RNA polymerase factor sigma-32 [Gammaproteobacteria bacterium RIFCSPHIGHO2_12_FULL_35_23]|nr:MAG: RNA polymerase factor sigma-32 [Gammaproteobacteria bacterium RIFCSPHIGHO2_12_FULL_35_23]